MVIATYIIDLGGNSDSNSTILMFKVIVYYIAL